MGDMVGAGKASTGGGAGRPKGGDAPAPGRGRVVDAAFVEAAFVEAEFICASTSSGIT
ncbi:hypothetical protein D3C72_2218760 [compost metagenome]